MFARGTNGAVWARDHSSAGWGAWHSEGGNLLGGTGPSSAYFGGITYILAVGTNKQLYLAEAGLTGFSPVGGLTTATPALTTAPGALAGFVRGTNGAAYFHRFLSSSPGWNPMGGAFSSGLGAANVAIRGSFTYTVGLGTNVLTDGTQITGVVDWDGFGLGSRALDLVALAVDSERCGDHTAADRLLARAAQVAGDDGLRCLVSYRVIGGLAVFTRERQAYGNSLGDEECAAESAILDRLQATGGA